MLRIRTQGRKTVFEYRGVRKQDALEKIFEHIAAFGVEQHRDPNDPKSFLPEVSAPPITAEWVVNPGTENETVEALTIPTVTKT